MLCIEIKLLLSEETSVKGIEAIEIFFTICSHVSHPPLNPLLEPTSSKQWEEKILLMETTGA